MLSPPDLWFSSLLFVLPAWVPMCLDLSMAGSLLPVTHPAQVPSPWNGHPANTALTPLGTLDHSVDGMLITLTLPEMAQLACWFSPVALCLSSSLLARRD